MFRRLLPLIALVALSVGQAHTPDTDPPRDPAHPARVEVLHIPSAGLEINGLAYVVSGPGAHPTLVILSWLARQREESRSRAGRPPRGMECDHVQLSRQLGSPGEFHFTQVSEDATAVIAWLRRPEVAARLGVEDHCIAIAGHSMGGWATARVCSRRSDAAWRDSDRAGGWEALASCNVAM